MICFLKLHERCRTQGKRYFWMNVSCELLEYLPQFKGAALGVFLAVALHQDDNNHAWDSAGRIATETGYGQRTVWRSLGAMCGEPEDGDWPILINGEPVLRRDHCYLPNSRRNTTNRYTVLPTQSGLVSATHAVHGRYINIDVRFGELLGGLFEGNAPSLATFLALHLQFPNAVNGNLHGEKRIVKCSIRALAALIGYHPRYVRLGLQKLTLVELDGLPVILRIPHLGTEDSYLLWPTVEEIDDLQPTGRAFAVSQNW